MQRLWLVTNPASGSTSDAALAAIEARLANAGVEIAGRTRFPDAPLPTIADLDGAKCDTLAVYAGDGTINAAACAVDRWDGQCLVLPGGTMNLLPLALHEGVDAVAVVEAALDHGRAVTLPYAGSQGHRAFVGIIAGPVAAWVHAREAVRKRDLRRLGRALKFAWLRTFAPGLRVLGGPKRGGRHRAVVITPQARALEVAAVSTDGFMAFATLGWTWLTGDWKAAKNVGLHQTKQVALAGLKVASTLFDGEAVTLKTPARITHGRTRLKFIATKPETAGEDPL